MTDGENSAWMAAVNLLKTGVNRRQIRYWSSEAHKDGQYGV